MGREAQDVPDWDHQCDYDDINPVIEMTTMFRPQTERGVMVIIAAPEKQKGGFGVGLGDYKTRKLPW